MGVVADGTGRKAGRRRGKARRNREEKRRNEELICEWGFFFQRVDLQVWTLRIS